MSELSPLFEEKFSEHSYGFRPGRSARQAVLKCREYIRAGHTWTVDIDLANKMDVPYQSLMKMFLSERIEKELSA